MSVYTEDAQQGVGVGAWGVELEEQGADLHFTELGILNGKGFSGNSFRQLAMRASRPCAGTVHGCLRHRTPVPT